MTGVPFEHPAAAKQLGDREFDGTQRDTLTSFIKTSGELVKAKRERDKALAERGRALATLERIRGIVSDPTAALVVDRVRAALEEEAS